MFIRVDKALKIAKINKKELNYIILVGGATRTPKIEEMIKNYFGNIEILKFPLPISKTNIFISL